jgi:hypothetical protein
MARYDEKTDIFVLDQKVTQPVGDNRIRVEDDDRGVISDGRPTITLYSDRSNLDSNGVDATRVWAVCRYAMGERISPTSRRETVTPYWPANELSVSAWILDNPGTPPRVYVKIGDDSLGDEIPVASWSGRKIITTVDMEYIEHIVVYQGTETVSFSVDQLADIAPTEVPVVNGVANATLTAQASGGGYATVTGDLMGVDDDLVITINDASVGSISAEAVPGNIDMGEISEIIARVLGPDRNPVADGMEVYFDFYPGEEVIGSLSALSAFTKTDTITNEENWSSNDITVNTYYPITELISVRTVEDENGYDFSDGATVDGNQITLDEPLWAPGDNGEPVVLSKMLCYVTYKTGGIAKVEFDPHAQGEAFVVCQAGQESCMCTVKVGVKGTGTKGTSGDGGKDEDEEIEEVAPGGWQTVEFGPEEFTWTPTNQSKLIQKKLGDVGRISDIEYVFSIQEHIVLWLGELNGFVYLYGKVIGKNRIVPGELQYSITEPFPGEILVQKKVEGEGGYSFSPLPGCGVKIDWKPYGEILGEIESLKDDNEDGVVKFTKGRPGTHDVLVTDKSDNNYVEILGISEYDVLTGEMSTERKMYLAKVNATWQESTIEGVPVTYHGVMYWRPIQEGPF